MTDTLFLTKAKTYYESMIDNVMDTIGDKKDLTDPKIQSLHRLACQETNVYMRILKKLSDGEKNPQKPDSNTSQTNNKGGLPPIKGIGIQPKDINLMTAVQNFCVSLYICMLVLCATICKNINIASMALTCYHRLACAKNTMLTPIRESFTNARLKNIKQRISYKGIYTHWMKTVQRFPAAFDIKYRVPMAVYFLPLIRQTQFWRFTRNWIERNIHFRSVIANEMKQSWQTIR